MDETKEWIHETKSCAHMHIVDNCFHWPQNKYVIRPRARVHCKHLAIRSAGCLAINTRCRLPFCPSRPVQPTDRGTKLAVAGVAPSNYKKRRQCRVRIPAEKSAPRPQWLAYNFVQPHKEETVQNVVALSAAVPGFEPETLTPDIMIEIASPTKIATIASNSIKKIVS